MKNWFSNCRNIDDVKQCYRELAKEHHPDKGGDTSVMQEINLQYSEAKKRFKNGGNYSQNTQQNSYTGGGFAEWMEAFKKHQKYAEAERKKREAEARQRAENEARMRREAEAKREAKRAKKKVDTEIKMEDLFGYADYIKSNSKKTQTKAKPASQMDLF